MGSFHIGQQVQAHSHTDGQPWLSGVVVGAREFRGSDVYEVYVHDIERTELLLPDRLRRSGDGAQLHVIRGGAR